MRWAHGNPLFCLQQSAMIKVSEDEVQIPPCMARGHEDSIIWQVLLVQGRAVLPLRPVLVPGLSLLAVAGQAVVQKP